MQGRRQRDPRQPRQFDELRATEIFCDRCGAAQPVRERLLLVLPDGELREYRCAACGYSVGSRRMTESRTLVPPSAPPFQEEPPA